MSKARDLAGIFNLNPTSGTTAQRPATAEVGEIYYNGTTGKTQIYTPTGWQDMASGIPYGNTAGRPAAVTGQPYFNGETARLEMYTSAGSWENIVQEVPGVSSISGNYSQATDSGVITIYGTNFVSGAYATAIGSNGVQINAASTVYNSLVQLTATFTGLSNANEPYDIKVTNPSNLFGLIPDALYVNASPVWQTASGSLGTFTEQVSVSLSATATDSDSTITYALASGSSLPSGVTLNSSTGAITGTLPEISTDTTYSFTINASDGLNVIPRTFTITSTNFIPINYLVVAGGGGGGYGYYGGGGGAGGYRTSFGTSGANSSAESTLSALSSVNYTVTVGQGGAGSTADNTRATSGSNSIFATITSTGGGGGGSRGDTNGNPEGTSRGAGGGSGGGTAFYSGLGGIGTANQGLNGGQSYGGGGGGASGAGATDGSGAFGYGGAGGNGLASTITGTSVTRAGGGGGGRQAGFSAVPGGSGGGGNGGSGNSPAATAGTANTGGGGGGGGINNSPGMAGGSGIVILRYPDTNTITVGAGLTAGVINQAVGTNERYTTLTAGSGNVSWS